MKTRKVDVAIIGGGTAGMVAYGEVRKHTGSIALIEGGPFGTTCARVGCMPSKLLVAPAEARHRLQALPAFGIGSDAGKVDGVPLMRRVRAERARFVGFATDTVAAFDPGHIVRAYARFADAHRLHLDAPDADQAPAADIECIEAARIVIASGSRPMIADALKPAGDRLISSDEVFYWQDLPQSVAVFGAGAIGVELGQALHRLGVRVRLFGRGGGIAGFQDATVRAVAVRTLAAEMPVSLDAREVRVSRDGDAVCIDFIDDEGRPRSERFDWLLAATGRTPNVDRLTLENTAIECDPRGVPVFDPLTMQTSVKHIFIAGDSAADRPILHEAADEGHLAGRNAGRFPEVLRTPRRTPMGIVFCDPQAAFVGARHARLLADRIDFASAQVSFGNQGRARVMQVNQGLLRVYAERGSGLLLGAELFGPDAEHLAHLLAWVVQLRKSVAEVLELPFYHPVIEEGLRTALRALLKELGMATKPPSPCLDCGPGT